MADGGGPDRLPSANRGVRHSGSDEAVISWARESASRTWAGLDWLAGSVDLGDLLTECEWWSTAEDLEGESVQVSDLEGLTAHLSAYGPRPKGETEADENGELVSGRRSTFVDPDQVVRSIAQAAFRYLFEGTGLVLAADAGPGSFYAYKFALLNVWGDMAGMIELGGCLTLRKGGRPSLRFELTGLGCAMYEQRMDPCADHAQQWLALRAKLERVHGLLTRIDVAFDDFDGKRNLALVRCMYEVGEFDYTFAGERKRPKYKEFRQSDGGDSFYIGHSSSEKQLRVYEKGKKHGDPDSKWTRWELQLRSSSRKRVALAVLEDPLAYMRGAFECLDFVSSCMARLEVQNEVSKATVKSVLRHARRMYGATLKQIRRLAPSDDDFRSLVEEVLTVDKVPRWAKTGRLTWADVTGIDQCPEPDESESDDE